MKKLVKNYGFLAVVLIINVYLLVFFTPVEKKSFLFIEKNIINFMFMLTPVFLCVGLLDVWVEKETMLKIIGRESGIRGILVSFLLGVVTAVPLYALLPVAGMLLKKGGKLLNVLIFICSCISIRIPLLLFEASSMGWRFTATRFIINIFIIGIIAFLIDIILTEEDKKKLYDNAGDL